MSINVKVMVVQATMTSPRAKWQMRVLTLADLRVCHLEWMTYSRVQFTNRVTSMKHPFTAVINSYIAAILELEVKGVKKYKISSIEFHS